MNQADAEDLFNTEERLRAILTPVKPRPAFGGELKRKLLSEAYKQELERNQRWLLIAAGLGGLVYALSVLALGIRASGWLVSLLALFLGWKKRQASMRPAH